MLGGDTRLGVVGGGSGSCPTFEVADGGTAGNPACSVGRYGRHQKSIETGTVQRWGVPVMPGDSTEKAPLGLPARGAGRGDLRRVDARGGRWWQLGTQAQAAADLREKLGAAATRLPGLRARLERLVLRLERVVLTVEAERARRGGADLGTNPNPDDHRPLTHPDHLDPGHPYPNPGHPNPGHPNLGHPNPGHP